MDDEEAVQRAVEAASVDGSLDVAVLAAGSGSGSPLLHQSLEDWQTVMATNLTGASSR